MDLLNIYGLSAVVVVMALTQVFKQYISDRWKPILPLVLGIIVVGLAGWSWTYTYILKGLIIGLFAMGSFDTIKKTVLGR